MDAQLLAFFEGILDLIPVVAFGAPLIAFLVDVAKRWAGLPDGYAPLLSGVLNLILYAVVYFVGEDRAGDVQSIVEGMHMLAPFILTLFAGVLAAAGSHYALSAIGMGYRHEDKPVG